MPPKITVAIATGRATEDTHYEKWMEVRRAFLDRELQSKHLNGEFGALLAAVLDEKLDYHIEYQMRALDKGTRQPDRILIVDRNRDDIGGAEYIDDFNSPGRGMVVEPMVSPRELELMPEATMGTCLSKRSNKLSMGCADKNTAIALCETEFLLMLDDCCLPGFGLVEAAYRACEKNLILLVGHQQMYLERAEEWEDTKVEVAQANWDGYNEYTSEEVKQLRRVFGVWAMPLSHILAVNGFNTTLDGDRGGLDLELLERMDRYVKAQDLRYATSHCARIYEIGHEHPWKKASRDAADWREKLPDGWGFKAPGPSLKEIRKAAGIRVGGDIFDLAGHAEDVEQAEHLGEIIEDVLDPENGDDE
jgi:hypothetical protein